MIHVRAMKVPRGNKHGPLYGYYASSGFGPPNTKEQIRRGILVATVATVLVLVGSLLTWLVYTEVFGSKVPIMGPLVMTLGVIMVVLAIRQFWVVWKQRKNPTTADKTDPAPADDEEMPCDSMLEMETWDGEKPVYLQNSLEAPCYEPAVKISNNINSNFTVPSCTFITTTSTTVVMPYSRPSIPPAPVPHTQTAEQQKEPPLSPTAAETSESGPKVKSCCDLSGMTRTGSMEAPNPRPVIRYSQGQLELLDKEAAAMGRTSPTLVASTPSHQSLGERSTSPHEHISHKSLSLSIERTDILETI